MSRPNVRFITTNLRSFNNTTRSNNSFLNKNNNPNKRNNLNNNRNLINLILTNRTRFTSGLQKLNKISKLRRFLNFSKYTISSQIMTLTRLNISNLRYLDNRDTLNNSNRVGVYHIKRKRHRKFTLNPFSIFTRGF